MTCSSPAPAHPEQHRAPEPEAANAKARRASVVLHCMHARAHMQDLESLEPNKGIKARDARARIQEATQHSCWSAEKVPGKPLGRV